MLPIGSKTRLSAQKRTVAPPSCSTRESAVTPYSRIRRDLVSTVKDSGPVPALPKDVIRAKPSISVRYSVPSAP